MDGKNSLAKDFTWLTTVIILFLFVLLGITTSLVQKEPGREEERKPAAICRKIVYLPEAGGGIEVWGDGTYRLVPSCSLMNALKQLEG